MLFVNITFLEYAKKILSFCSKLNPQKRNNVPSSTDGIYESGAAFSENLSL
jgi:hypothetical protein